MKRRSADSIRHWYIRDLSEGQPCQPGRSPQDMLPARDLFSYRKYWAHRFGTAPFLPMSREEMDALGWDSCDIIIVTGDAYVDHPSFGMAIIGRVLEAQGFRVGIIAQPDWHSAEPFKALGKPNLFFGVTAGNMDSMVNRYTRGPEDPQRRRVHARRRGRQAAGPLRRSCTRSAAAKRSTTCRSCSAASKASLRRIAHYDYWSDKVRRSMLLDAKCRPAAVRQRRTRDRRDRAPPGERASRSQTITDVRGTAFVRRATPEGWIEIDSTTIDTPGRVEDRRQSVPDDRRPGEGARRRPCAKEEGRSTACAAEERGRCRRGRACGAAQAAPSRRQPRSVTSSDRDRTVIRLPSYEAVRDDPVLYAHAIARAASRDQPRQRARAGAAHGDATSGSTRRRSR